MEETREFKHNYNVDNNINSILYDDKQQFSADPYSLTPGKVVQRKGDDIMELITVKCEGSI